MTVAGAASEAVQSRYLRYEDWSAASLTIENALLRLRFSSATGLLSEVEDREHRTTLQAHHKASTRPPSPSHAPPRTSADAYTLCLHACGCAVRGVPHQPERRLPIQAAVRRARGTSALRTLSELPAAPFLSLTQFLACASLCCLQALFPAQLPPGASIRVVRGSVVSSLCVQHHRFDVSYELLTRPLHALQATFAMTVTASAQANTEVMFTMETDVLSREHFYTHNGWQFLRRTRTAGPRASLFYPMVAALRLQDEPQPPTEAGDAPTPASSRRLTLVTSHTCAASAPASGRVELLIHRHLSQDDGRGLSEAVQDNSRQELTLTFTLQSLDALQPALPSSNAHFDDERSFNEHMLRVQHPVLTFLLSRASSSAPPAGFAEFSSVHARALPLLASIDEWHRTQLSVVTPLARPFPSNLHLHSLLARDAVSDDVALRVQHLGVDVTQESDRDALPDDERSLRASVRLDLTEVFPPTTHLSELRRVGLTLNHRWPFNGRRRHRHVRVSGGAEGDGVDVLDADSLHPGWMFRADAAESVLDTLLLRQFLSQRQAGGGRPVGANQNSEEEGVFISEAALRAEREKKKAAQQAEEAQRGRGEGGGGGRRLLAEDGEAEAAPWTALSLPVLHLEPYQLQSFLLHLSSDEEEARIRSLDDVDPHPTPHRPGKRSVPHFQRAQAQAQPTDAKEDKADTPSPTEGDVPGASQPRAASTEFPAVPFNPLDADAWLVVVAVGHHPLAPRVPPHPHRVPAGRGLLRPRARPGPCQGRATRRPVGIRRQRRARGSRGDRGRGWGCGHQRCPARARGAVRVRALVVDGVAPNPGSAANAQVRPPARPTQRRRHRVSAVVGDYGSRARRPLAPSRASPPMLSSRNAERTQLLHH